MKLITKLFILIDIIIIFCFLMVYGPIDKARVYWITTSMNTMSHRYLAHIFYSDETIEKVMNTNYFVEINDLSDASEITMAIEEEHTTYSSVYEREILERDKDDLYKLIEFKYNGFSCYLVAIYDPKRIHTATTEYKLNKGQILTEIAKNNGAVVAINGGGYSWGDGYPEGFVISNGEVIYARSNKKYMSAGFNSDGVLLIGKYSINDIREKNIVEALSFSPALIVNGEPIKIVGTGGSGQNPRTVLAQRKDGIVLFLVVNGYDETWRGRGGVYLNELLVILQRYGAYNAINMDGGSSTTLVIDGKLINTPCEPQKEGQDFIRTAWILK